ncbi:MAG: SPFH domain-containing protein [Candidatus Dojkabacteria bacterium]|nr:MAG: SPFH domain-containing protein [Candidatus Dojkabacteria bacterium]
MIIFVIVIALLLSSIKIIPQNHVSIVEQLGRFNRVIPAGINLVIPVIERIAVRVNLAVRNFLFEFDAVSNDKVAIRLKANLIYAVDVTNVYAYWYELSDPKQTVASFVENYVRSFIATQTHEELLEKREEIAAYLLEHLSEKFLKWGIRIDGFQVTDIMFPTEITDAMSKVVASVRLREAAMNEAEARKVRVVKEAEAEKDSRILMGEGVAGERQAIIDGLKRSIDDMKTIPGLNTHEVMNLIVLSQYFDTIKSIGNTDNTKVMFLNPAPEGASDIIQQLSSALEISSTPMPVQKPKAEKGV